MFLIVQIFNILLQKAPCDCKIQVLWNHMKAQTDRKLLKFVIII